MQMQRFYKLNLAPVEQGRDVQIYQRGITIFGPYSKKVPRKENFMPRYVYQLAMHARFAFNTSGTFMEEALILLFHLSSFRSQQALEAYNMKNYPDYFASMNPPR